MKSKYILAVSCLIGLALFLTAGAQVKPGMSYPVPDPGNDLFFGQVHYYNAFFRGNGESVTTAKLVFSNSDETNSLTEGMFNSGKAVVSDIVGYQQILPQRCLEYNYETGQTCVRFGDPDYHSPYYYEEGSTVYKKLTLEKNGNSYKFIFPEAIKPGSDGAVILSYIASGYVKKSLGSYKFEFETLRVPERVQEVRVAVDVESDYVLKGKRSEVDYASSPELSSPLPSSGAASSKQLDSIASRIGNYGALVKQTQNLSPNESFIVKGEYAKNAWLLSLKGIFWAVLVILLIIGVIWFIHRRWKKRQVIDVQASPVQTLDTLGILNIWNALTGLVSALLVFGLTLMLRYVTTYLNKYLYDDLMPVLFMLLILILYVFFLFGPAVFIGFKHGWKSAAAVFLCEFLWLIVLVILYVVVMAPLQSG